MRDMAYKALSMREKLMNETQKEPTMDDLANALGARREEIVFALDSISDPVSLYEPLHSDGAESICVVDQVSDTRNTDENWLEQIALNDAIERLSSREKHILSLRFFYGRTQI